MILKGEKIYLKTAEVKNAQKFLKWTNDPEVNKFLSFIPKKTLKEEIDWIKKTSEDDTEEIWNIYIKENDKLIGNTGCHDLKNPEQNLRIGIMIGAKEEWGKGYATDVFKTITKYMFEKKSAKKINLTVHPDNIPAQKVYEKSGFVRKGIERSLNERTGEMVDWIYMELEKPV